jgi:uncharacterized damage-inducible protein DinB
MRRILAIAVLAASLVQAQAPELGGGWLEEFNLASRQTLQLAEAIPADKFVWRPRPGVRSVSEVFMHIAIGNYYLLDQAGATIPPDTPPIAPDLEKKVTSKPEVIAWLKRSTGAVRKCYPTTDRSRKVTFFGKSVPSDNVFLRILVHSHEHMGQSIAYARMIGVVPPWSK